MSNVTIVSEDVYSDGSGSAGTYRVQGQTFSGIYSGEGTEVTVTALSVGTGYRGVREKRGVSSAARLVEAHVRSINGLV